MKKSPWRIVAVIGFSLLFGARLYFSHETRKNKEKQAQMLEDLSRMQREEQLKNAKPIEVMSQEEKQNLENISAGLDSMGTSLKENQKKFEEKMKKYNESIK